MCGIAGIVGSHGERVSPSQLAAMVEMLHHRGPDASGLHLESNAGLGHARLSIIDVAGGRQPMSNDSGTLWLTFNGEIFNYIELREDLVRRGVRFRTQSDTEVILRLLEADGPAALASLNGQWALGLWDSRTQTLFLSRDRMGIRPLFYTSVNHRLLFASEIKALFVDRAVPRELDPKALDEIFTFWSALTPRTAFKGVFELPPGHSLTWREGRTAISRHWTPTFPAAAGHDSRGSRPADDASAQLASLLEDATRLRLRSDVPVGVYLSGGLDSSVIAALATRVGGTPVRTFSVAFNDPACDESSYQRQVVRALGTDHHQVRISNEDIGRVFPDVMWHSETPLVRTGPAPLYMLSRVARDHGCKVVLTGEGADEVLGGYDIFKEAKIRRFWSADPGSTRRPSLVQRLYPYMTGLHRQAPEALQAFFSVAPGDLANPCFSHLPRWKLASRLRLFFSDAVRAEVGGYDGPAEVARRLPNDYRSWDPFCQAQYLETTQLLPGYILSSQGDRAAMAHGVEGRFPFLDRHVVAFAAALPPALKMKVLKEKYLLKLMSRGLVPETIRQRPKQPYRAPEGKAFFTAQRAPYVDDLLSAAQVRSDGIFRPDAVEKLVRKFRDGRPMGTTDNMAIVGILSTQLILDRFINNFGSAWSHDGQLREAMVS